MMSETPHSNVEFGEEDEIFLRVHQLLDEYFPEDNLWVEVEGFSTEDIVDFLFGQLLDTGLDPELIMREYGIIE